MANEFKIGTSAGSRTLLADIGVVEPAWDPPHSADREDNGDGSARDVGWTTLEWHWGYLGSQAYDALRVYCPGASATVYIRTKTSTGAYANYYGKVIWPLMESWHNSKVIDFTLEFRSLQSG